MSEQDYPDQQRVADQMKQLVGRRPSKERRVAYDAIVNFERAGWYPSAFYEALPLTLIMDKRGIVYAGYEIDVAVTVETVIRDYLIAVENGGGTVVR